MAKLQSFPQYQRGRDNNRPLDGFDSHEGNCGLEWIVFDSHACLPLYIVTVSMHENWRDNIVAANAQQQKILSSAAGGGGAVTATMSSRNIVIMLPRVKARNALFGDGEADAQLADPKARALKSAIGDGRQVMWGGRRVQVLERQCSDDDDDVTGYAAARAIADLVDADGRHGNGNFARQTFDFQRDREASDLER